MKKIIFPLVFVLFGCHNEQNTSTQNSFYNELDSVKQLYAGSEITINRKKFNEVSEGMSGVYLYTNADKDNITEKVRFHDSAKYELSYGQINEFEYDNNTLEKNKMVLVSSSDDNFAYQTGWISIEYIEQFSSLAKYFK